MKNYATNSLKQITIKSGKKYIFYNLNEICSIIEKNNQVICNLVSQKEIPLQHDFDTLKQFLLNNNFELIGQNILINRNEIKMIRDCEGGAKIYTKCSSVIHVNENYSKLKRALQLV